MEALEAARRGSPDPCPDLPETDEEVDTHTPETWDTNDENFTLEADQDAPTPDSPLHAALQRAPCPMPLSPSRCNHVVQTYLNHPASDPGGLVTSLAPRLSVPSSAINEPYPYPPPSSSPSHGPECNTMTGEEFQALRLRSRAQGNAHFQHGYLADKSLEPRDSEPSPPRAACAPDLFAHFRPASLPGNTLEDPGYNSFSSSHRHVPSKLFSGITSPHDRVCTPAAHTDPSRNSSDELKQLARAHAAMFLRGQ